MTWYSIILLVCVMAQQDQVQACDDQCQNELITKFTSVLQSTFDSKLNWIYTKLNKIDVIESELSYIRGLVEDIESQVDSVTARSSQVTTETTYVKSMADKIYNDVRDMRNDMSESMEELKNTTHSIEDNLEELKNATFYIENSFKEFTNTTFSIEDTLEDLKNATHSLQDDLGELTNKTFSIEDTLEDLNNATHSLEDELGELTNKTISIESAFEEQKYTTISIDDNVKALKNITFYIEDALEEMKNTSSSIQNNIMDVITNSINTKELIVKIRENTTTETAGLIGTVKLEMENQANAIVRQLNPSNTGISKRLKTIETLSRCEVAEGFHMSNHCFKLLNDRKRTWTEARSACQSVGALAETPDSVLAPLRRYLYEEFGTIINAWVGARSDGYKFVWQKEMTALNSKFDPGRGVSTTYCLELDGTSSDWSNNPYHYHSCSSTYYALCEVSSE